MSHVKVRPTIYYWGVVWTMSERMSTWHCMHECLAIPKSLENEPKGANGRDCRRSDLQKQRTAHAKGLARRRQVEVMRR
jgi:hypothetical protein